MNWLSLTSSLFYKTKTEVPLLLLVLSETGTTKSRPPLNKRSNALHTHLTLRQTRLSSWCLIPLVWSCARSRTPSRAPPPRRRRRRRTRRRRRRERLYKVKGLHMWGHTDEEPPVRRLCAAAWISDHFFFFFFLFFAKERHCGWLFFSTSGGFIDCLRKWIHTFWFPCYQWCTPGVCAQVTFARLFTPSSRLTVTK